MSPSAPRRLSVRTAGFAALLLATHALALPLPAPAASPPAPHGSPALTPKVEEVVLPNGMRFLLMERREAPVFTGMIQFRVGSVDETTGQSGLAHMFEHMAFKGTSRIGTKDFAAEKPVLDRLREAGAALSAEASRPEPDPARLAELRRALSALQEEHKQHIVPAQFDQYYTAEGGQDLNAETGPDFTTYYVSLPSNRIELWMLLESARLRDPVLREFYAERDVVMEERRMRIESQPTGRLYEALLANAFSAHPYRVPTVGWMSDLEAITLEQAEEFHRRHYSPSNAVAALVGDIDIPRTRELIARYFGTIPRRDDPPPVVTREPESLGEKRVEIGMDASPQVWMAWHKPNPPHPDADALEVLDAILTGGPAGHRSSRLHRALVVDRKIAQMVGSSPNIPGRRFPNLFAIYAVPLEGHGTREIEEAIETELARIRAEGVTAQEVRKVLNQIEAAFVRELESNDGMAAQLVTWTNLAGDWRQMTARLERLRALGPAEIQRVTRKYFAPAGRTVVTLVRREKPAAPAAPPEAKP